MSSRGEADFWEWFDQVRGDLSILQIERQARCPRGRIGNAYSAKKEPTATVIASIADGLGLDRGEVFRQAGILRPQSSEHETREELEVLGLYRRASPVDNWRL
jgi:hypothetical protein